MRAFALLFVAAWAMSPAATPLDLPRHTSAQAELIDGSDAPDVQCARLDAPAPSVEKGGPALSWIYSDTLVSSEPRAQLGGLVAVVEPSAALSSALAWRVRATPARAGPRTRS